MFVKKNEVLIWLQAAIFFIESLAIITDFSNFGSLLGGSDSISNYIGMIV